MGQNSIERGNRDSWTITPKMVDAARAARGDTGKTGKGTKGKGGKSDIAEFNRLFHDPAKRDPRGYVIPANQPDFLTATKFVNALMATGVKVHRAGNDFAV